MNHAERYRELAPNRPGRRLPWLEALRAEAERRFFTSGFPSPREEEWKYTNLAALEKKRFAPAAGIPPGVVGPATVARFRLRDAWCLVFVDGVHAAGLSDITDLPEPVMVSPMAEALERRPEAVEALFHKVAGGEDHGFVHFTTAYFGDGVCLQVPAGLVLERPLQILHFSTRSDGLAVLRNLLRLERHAEAQVVETYVGLEDAAGLTAAVTEISLDENSRLVHYKLQRESGKAYHFGGIYAVQQRSARLCQHHTAFGGLLARTEIHSELGDGAECEMDGLFLATGRRHLDAHTLIRHCGPHGTSRESYRGIAADRGRGVFSGRIVVAKDAQKTDAEMSSRNLLLSEDAEIDSKPQLEIHADDVRCAHGVTVGQLDPNAVFYLESRGIDEVSARTMLTFAFANAQLDRIRLDSLKNLALSELLRALPQSDVRKDWL